MGQARREVAPGIHVMTTLGNIVSIETARGIVQIDTGHSRKRAEEVIAELRQASDLPLRMIVYSHGHFGYNDVVPVWLEHAEARGEPRPPVVAHENVVKRYRRYLLTSDLQQTIVELQFRSPKGSLRGRKIPLHFPDITFSRALQIDDPKRPMELFWAPSETDDCLAVWIPGERILYAGAGHVSALPNIGTPQKIQRDTLRWVDTLEYFESLKPELLIPEHGHEIVGRELIRDVLTSTIRALRYIHDETIRLMNEGLTVAEILSTITYPDDLFDRPWLVEGYGHRDYIVRDVYRSQNGWWEDRNPTNLHPAHPKAAAEAVLSALTDRTAVLDRAKALFAAGQGQLALHVVDLLALADGTEPEVKAAKALKAEICRALARANTSYVSKSLYYSTAQILKGEAE
ncbi:MAG: alkyl sulfatase [Alphaproteobacteria bacterium]|nr:alkyl sulfatase [Alphaproteobacteria bacterium]